jgi:DNA helicase-2/ATP-dependent DNA helicase PcrA
VDVDALLADLDPEQRTAVTAPSTLVAVIAGAGSGKTRVLTRRVAYRIATATADAQHTLVLTFTREAAGELRRRLTRLGLREHVEAGTFHSVMLRVLRQRWEDRDKRPLTIVPDRDRFVAEVVGRDRRLVKQMLTESAWAGARGLDAGGYRTAARQSGRRPAGGIEATATVLADVTDLKRKRGVIDFDDVLVHVLRDMRRDEPFADALRWRFRHLLVDEAQDLNPVQHQLVDQLRRGTDDLFLVGDPEQAIYGFNGADPSLLVDVADRFPGVQIVRLPVNHRSTPQVVRAATHVLSASGTPSDSRSDRPDGQPVREAPTHDEHDEAQRVVDIVRAADPNVIRSGQLAVLARTHAQLQILEAALTARSIPVHRVSSASGSPLQMAVRAAAANTSASRLRAWAHDTLDGTSPEAGSPRTRAPADDRVDDAERRVAAAALDFLRAQPLGDGATFRSWVATTNPFDDTTERGVELLTFHAAKGREWHTVVVTGVETSLVPHRSATTQALRQEEARLLYVAMTRAADQLTITRAARRGGYAREPSPFIDGLPLGDAPPAAPPARTRHRRGDSIGSALRDWRESTARRARILPNQVCSDRDLAAIARHRPTSVDELESVTSLGPLTAARLTPDLLHVLGEAGNEPET